MTGVKSFSGCHESFGVRNGASQNELPETSSVYPSGEARATISPSTAPLGRLSTMTC